MVRLFKPSVFKLIVVGSSLIVLGLIFWLLVWPMINGNQVDASLLGRTADVTARARDLVKSGNSSEAISVLEKAAVNAKSSDDKAVYYSSQASIVAESGDINRAIEISKKSYVLTPLKGAPTSDVSSKEFTDYVTSAYEELNNATKSNNVSSATNEYSENEAEAINLNMIASAYDRVGDISNAVLYYQMAIDFLAAHPDVIDMGDSQYYKDRITYLNGQS